MLDEADRLWIRDQIRQEIKAALAAQAKGKQKVRPQKIEEPLVELIFEHWKECWGKTDRTKLDDTRRRVIRRALQNYDADTLMAALTGYTQSGWHTGDDNSDGRVYDEITLHLRDATHIEAGLAFARNGKRADKLIRRGLEVARNLDEASTRK